MEESQAASKKASNAQNTWKTDKGDLASSIKAGAPIADLFPGMHSVLLEFCFAVSRFALTGLSFLLFGYRVHSDVL